MFFFQGEDDLNTPTVLVREYEARIRAPRKALVLIPGAGHMAIVFHDQLLRLLDSHVRPLALASAPTDRRRS
jgi:pimeloyl-ACP methyl ester carboxylesterase